MNSTSIVKTYNNMINDGGEYVLYLVQSSLYIDHNYSLRNALINANKLDKPLLIIFIIDFNFKMANTRNMNFLIQGLSQFKDGLNSLNLDLIIIDKATFNKSEMFSKACLIITDNVYMPFQVAYNNDYFNDYQFLVIVYENNLLVPVPTVYHKLAYNAHIIRTHIFNHLNEMVRDNDLIYNVRQYIYPSSSLNIDELYELVENRLPYLKNSMLQGGYTFALSQLQYFINNHLSEYNANKKIDFLKPTSSLSAYLHYGHISPYTIYCECLVEEQSIGYKSFIEQLVVRRELSFNYVYYAQELTYSFKYLPKWAINTMEEHLIDNREFLYTLEELIAYKTHDKAWNATQKQLINEGYIPNYLRMYWGKKIIEWSLTYEDAFTKMCYINDYYQLDGRDPNGIVGILWCFGLHDRAWFNRDVFGKLRYMNYQGLLNKSNIIKYIDKINMIE